MKVLIVDNHPLFREGLIRSLESKPDYQVIGKADSIAQAVSSARELKPDLILFDTNFPDEHGLDAVRSILAETPETKIVIMTNHSSEEFLVKAFRAGVHGFLLTNNDVFARE